jgi:ankyrin repeat protein
MSRAQWKLYLVLKGFENELENNRNVAERLLNSGGADINHHYPSRGTILNLVCKSHPRTWKTVIECDPQTGIRFWRKIGTERLDLVRFLIAHGANPNIQDQDGKTPVDHAHDNQCDQIVNVLTFCDTDDSNR